MRGDGFGAEDRVDPLGGVDSGDVAAGGDDSGGAVGAGGTGGTGVEVCGGAVFGGSVSGRSGCLLGLIRTSPGKLSRTFLRWRDIDRNRK
jgi:hypothetical protein